MNHEGQPTLVQQERAIMCDEQLRVVLESVVGIESVELDLHYALRLSPAV